MLVCSKPLQIYRCSQNLSLCDGIEQIFGLALPFRTPKIRTNDSMRHFRDNCNILEKRLKKVAV